MKTIQKAGLGLGAAALLLGGAAVFPGLAQADDTASTPTPAASASGQGWGNGPRHGQGSAMRGDQAAGQLAEALGLDETKVSEALATARDALRDAHQADTSGTRPTLEERRAELAAELANALGIDEAKVTEALTALDATRDATRAAALQERLGQAVTEGKLTQAEADAVEKAVDTGVMGGGRGPGGKGMARGR